MTDIFSYYQLAATKRVSKGDKSVLIVSLIMNMQHYRAIITWLQVTDSWTCGWSASDELFNVIDFSYTEFIPIKCTANVLYYWSTSLVKGSKICINSISSVQDKVYFCLQVPLSLASSQVGYMLLLNSSDGSCLCDMYYDKSPTHSYE